MCIPHLMSSWMPALVDTPALVMALLMHCNEETCRLWYISNTSGFLFDTFFGGCYNIIRKVHRTFSRSDPFCSFLTQIFLWPLQLEENGCIEAEETFQWDQKSNKAYYDPELHDGLLLFSKLYPPFFKVQGLKVDFECENPTYLISNSVFSILFDGPVHGRETACTVFMSAVPIGPPKTTR